MNTDQSKYSQLRKKENDLITQLKEVQGRLREIEASERRGQITEESMIEFRNISVEAMQLNNTPQIVEAFGKPNPPSQEHKVGTPA